MKLKYQILKFISILSLLCFFSACTPFDTTPPSQIKPAIKILTPPPIITPSVTPSPIITPTPTPVSITVYRTKTGKCYHKDGCSYLKSKIPISLNDAQEKNLKPCSRCRPLK